MATRFVLFAENETVLKERLARADYTLPELADKFTQINWIVDPGPDGSNNPWTVYDRQGLEIPLADENGDRGYGLQFDGDSDDVEVFFQALKDAAISHNDPAIEQIASVDFAPLPLTIAPNWQHWCTGSGLGQRFASRAQAEQLINASTLASNNWTGVGVKIVLMDQGVSNAYVNSQGNGANFGNDLIFELTVNGETRISGKADAPYVKTPREHGSMMVRSLLALAPDAKIYDLPLIPRQISDVTSFTLVAAFAVYLLRFIELILPGPWIFVNAWGIDDRFGEGLWGEYTNNKNHLLNVQYGKLGQSYDVVFAAGNSGQFCPDPEAGPYDRGPGRSIFGANGHPDVTSVGAVRGDAQWVGTSSQGPGPDDFNFGPSPVNEKPDFCAPSWFVEQSDKALRSGGTSAATAITGGALAALRQKWSTAEVTPAEMRQMMRTSARRDWQTGWNGRMGMGILNLEELISHIPFELAGKKEAPSPETQS